MDAKTGQIRPIFQTALFILLAALGFLPTVDPLDHQQNEYDKRTGTVTVVGQNLQVVRGSYGLLLLNYSGGTTSSVGTETPYSASSSKSTGLSRALEVETGKIPTAKIWNAVLPKKNTTDKSFSKSAAWTHNTLVKRKAEESNEKPISFLVEPSPYSLAVVQSGGGSRASGPYFEVNKTRLDVAVKAGQNVVLDCTVVLLKGRTVSWLRRKAQSLELLTVGNITYYNDPRLSLRFRYPDNWRLAIDLVKKEDEGEYHCQVATHPVKTLVYHLKVIAPEVVIIDDMGQSVIERHYKAESSLHLTCRATYIEEFEEKAEWQKDGQPMNRKNSRVKIRLAKNDEEGESNLLLSILWLDTGDSGNYTCVVGTHAKYTVVVHVVNGELPAAVQHESEGKTGKVSPVAEYISYGLFISVVWLIV